MHRLNVELNGRNLMILLAKAVQMAYFIRHNCASYPPTVGVKTGLGRRSMKLKSHQAARPPAPKKQRAVTEEIATGAFPMPGYRRRRAVHIHGTHLDTYAQGAVIVR